ncbi:hypothetical protein [Legionella clemsonensis]|uniref:Uncharacterized protein n=1 Tax=Legionella clemsonensis TaxID=1867846 RepID=A0A222P4G7_9GAMM|nr:hypothetical protein [Legionella clemsonensis]ASQ46736.1 hypothetical protein clem_10950 [Legionella clemsonensis]
MGKKTAKEKELEYFNKLKNPKVIFINHLQNNKFCNSMAALQEASQKYQQLKMSIKIRPEIALTDAHKKELEDLDEKIRNLIKERFDQFRAKPAPAVDVLQNEVSVVTKDEALSSSEGEDTSLKVTPPKDEVNEEKISTDLPFGSVEHPISHPATHGGKPTLAADPIRLKKLKQINEKLSVLGEKAEELRNYEEAYREVETIIIELNKLNRLYLHTNALSDQDYKAQAEQILSPEKMIKIEEFRGLKMKKVGELLLNLLAAISTAFIGYGIAAAVKGDLLLFRVNTDTKNKVNNLNTEIQTAFAPGA